jgi:hypothetical protein
MKKTVLIIAAMAMAAVFLGCPTDAGGSSGGGDSPVPINRPDGASGKIPEPILLDDGAYVANTKIEIDTRGDGMSVIYTLDGTEPDPENPATRIYDAEFPPRMKFEGGAESFTLKARAVKPGRESSDVATGTYTEASIAPNNVMQGIIADIQAASGGASAADPITVVLPAGTKLWDVGIKFQDPDNPRREQYDGLYHIFNETAGRYFILDMSAVLPADWQDYDDDDNTVFSLAGISSTNQQVARPNKARLVNVIYPAGLQYIGPRAFQGCTNYKDVRLDGLASLERVAANAFQGNSLRTLTFAGCSSLKSLGDSAFNGITNVTTLDMSETAIEMIGERCFGSSGNLQWIEYPPSLNGIGSYQFSNPTSLKYVRHRSLIQPDWAWCVYNYHNNASGDAATHMHEGIDQAYAAKNDHMFVIFHPNSSPWVKNHGGFNFADDDGYYFTAQNVPLGSAIDAPAATDYAGIRAALAAMPGFYDDLRGDALIAAQEQYRGVQSLELNITGLAALDGQTVTSSAGGETGTIAGGSVSLTIGAPTVTQLMTPDTFQEVTIPYSDPRNKHPFDLNADDHWTVSNGNDGYYGLPWITHPANPTQYAVLTLTLSGGGTLVQEVTGVQGIDEYGGKYDEKHTVTYVWVDKDVVAHRVMRASADRKSYLHTVALSLKAGWNLVGTRSKVGAGDAAPDYEAGGEVSIWISGGIAGGVDALNGTTSTRDSITYRPIGWVKK